MIYLYNILGLIMFTWYTAVRWTLLGNVLGEYIMIDGLEVFKLKWWFAPINIITALLSIPFLIITLFMIDKSFFGLLGNLTYCIAIFLLARNLYYTIEDIIDYKANPTKLQFIFVLLDIAMAVYTLLWMLRYRVMI
jgi:hypothetical protein